VWPIHPNFLFLVSTFMSSCTVTFHRSSLETIFGHHILNIYLGHLFTKVCILLCISFVTCHVSHPYRSTAFTQALNILISLTYTTRIFYAEYKIIFIGCLWVRINRDYFP
jgi:hypothetical protein